MEDLDSEGAHPTMTKFLSIGLACLGLVFFTPSPASAGALGSSVAAVGKAAQSESAVHQVRKRYGHRHRHRHHRRGRNAAIGILGAAAAAAIISESARSERRRSRSSCRSLDYRCANGSARACRDLDYYCY